MKYSNKYILISLLPFLFSCSNKIEESNSKDSTSAVKSDTLKTNQTSSQGREIELTSIYLPIKGQGKWLLELNYLELKIRVYREVDIEHEIQTLGPIGSDIEFNNEYYLNNPLSIFNPEDLNFDGFKDLKIPTTTGTGGTWYEVYLFNPKNNQFEKNNALSELTSVSGDSITKKINSHDVGGMGGAFYNYTTYSWKNNNLFLDRRETQEGLNENSPEVLIRTVLKVNNQEGMDTVAVVKIWEEKGKETWCLQKGEWDALKDSPFPGEDAVKLDGRKGGCGE